MKESRKTPELLARIQRMWAAKWKMKSISENVGVPASTIQQWLRPERAVEYRKRKWAKESIELRNARRAANPGSYGGKKSENVETQLTAERLRKQIPLDVRTPAQQLMGEPIPGRRALDKLDAKRAQRLGVRR